MARWYPSAERDGQQEAERANCRFLAMKEVDVSGARHNVMIEIGYALKHVHTGRMVFYFQKSEICDSVPFDVSHLAYDEIFDSAEIRTKTQKRIQTILEQAGNGEI